LVLSPPVRRALAAAIVAAVLAVPATASAITYAPVDQPGPPLSVPANALDASLQCSGDPTTGPTPVLLVHGTGSNPHDNFSWNWGPALDALGTSWCTVALPGNGMDDIQVGAEYVVNAIRTMHTAAGRRISIIGHSQGGMIPRWALRFWPDTRSMVDDQIGIAPSNHGTRSAQLTCIPDCAPAIWQQRDDSEFIKALNSHQETFAGISYTAIYSHFDVIVTPNSDATGSSSLHTGDGQITNVAVQEVCPLDVSDHLLLGTQDLVAYDLAIDALNHPGSADPARAKATDPGICTPLALMPGINPATAPTDAATAIANLLATIATHPHVPAEPALACYVTASCNQAPSVTTKGKCKKRKQKKLRRLGETAKKKHKKCKKKHREKRR
jgi:pimeloyl-ACP methyl ester carboxylesterase